MNLASGLYFREAIGIENAMLYSSMNRPRRVLVPEGGGGRNPGGVLRRALPWLTLGMILAGLTAWILLRGRSQVDAPYSGEHRRLLVLLGTGRPIAARLSGGLSCSPYYGVAAKHPSKVPAPSATVSRGTGAPPVPALPSRSSVRSAVLEIRRAAERNPSPENRAALAVPYIVQGIRRLPFPSSGKRIPESRPLRGSQRSGGGFVGDLRRRSMDGAGGDRDG
jgi:hypothetical protein